MGFAQPERVATDATDGTDWMVGGVKLMGGKKMTETVGETKPRCKTLDGVPCDMQGTLGLVCH